jgi:hypothetical protein
MLSIFIHSILHPLYILNNSSALFSSVKRQSQDMLVNSSLAKSSRTELTGDLVPLKKLGENVEKVGLTDEEGDEYTLNIAVDLNKHQEKTFPVCPPCLSPLKA